MFGVFLLTAHVYLSSMHSDTNGRRSILLTQTSEPKEMNKLGRKLFILRAELTSRHILRAIKYSALEGRTSHLTTSLVSLWSGVNR